MRIVVPYTHVVTDTWAAVPDADFVPVDHEHGYRELLNLMWEDGLPFILVEHDVAPTREQLTAIWDCPGDWCCYGYGPGFWLPVFACVKFGPGLMAATPGVWEHEWEWNMLDQEFARYAVGLEIRPCWHWPHVRHVATGVRREPTIEQQLAHAEIEAATLRFLVDGTIPDEGLMRRKIIESIPAEAA